MAAMTLKEENPASSTLLYQRAMARRAASLIAFLENIILRDWQSPYTVFISGYCSNSIAARCFCPSVHFRPDLNRRYLKRMSNFLRVSPLG